MAIEVVVDRRQEYYLQDGRGPFESVQAAMDALGLDKATRPKHNRWDRLSTQLKESIRRRPAVGTVSLKAKFQPGDKVRFSNRATKYKTTDLRGRTRTILDAFYDPEDHCCFYELSGRGKERTLGYFRSFMLIHADGNQHTIGRPRQKRRYNRHTKLLFKPPNQNLRGKGMLPYDLPLPLNPEGLRGHHDSQGGMP